MRRLTVAFVCLGLATGCAGAGLDWFDEPVRVMSINVYQGTELYDAIDAVLSGDEMAILLAVSEAFATVQATDFHTRAVAIADQIEDANADLVGLQEAAIWRIQVPGDSGSETPTPAETVAYDFVQILLDELASRGLHYELAVEFRGVDVEFPGLTPEMDVMDVRFTDREAILAKQDGRVEWSNPQSGAFQVNLPIAEGLEVVRGWVSVEATVVAGHLDAGQTFKLVSTHLEADHPDVRMAQAGEILEGPTATAMPVVLVGDFNYDLNDAEDPGATWFLQVTQGAGFELAAPAAGSTCCGDELVQDPAAVHTERLDLIFCRGGFEVSEEAIRGGDPADMVGGLWPSDHGGVSCALELPPDVEP